MFPLHVFADSARDAFELFPTHITFVGAWDESQPLFPGFATAEIAWFSSVIADQLFGLAIGVRPSVNGAGQHAMHRTIDAPLPASLSAQVARGDLQAMLQEPHQCLPHRTQFNELTEDEKDGLLHPQV